MIFNSAELVSIETVLGAFCRNHVPAHRKRIRKISYRILGNEIRVFEWVSYMPESDLWLVDNTARLQYLPESHSWLLCRLGKSGDWVKVVDAPEQKLWTLLEIAIRWFFRVIGTDLNNYNNSGLRKL